MEEKKGMLISFIMLREVDLPKAFELALGVAEKHGVIFSGINPYTLGGFPPRDRHAVAVFVPFDKGKEADDVIEEIALGTGLLERDKDYLLQFSPWTQYVPTQARPATST